MPLSLFRPDSYRDPSSLFFCAFLFSLSLSAQYGEWTWMHGDTALNHYGRYNVKGVPDNISHPGAKYATVFWQDTAQNFWIYGGAYYNFTNHTPANMWRYNSFTNQWTWMMGDSTLTLQSLNPVHGSLGVSSPLNRPGQRGFGAASWTDLNNNLWLFGGNGNYSRNDLWKYSPMTNEWTWMHADSAAGDFGVYGTLGVPSVNNRPPARYETTATWVDNNGNLWLFGGMNNSSSTYFLNDLWRYNPVTDEWTWMHGSNSGNAPAVYGTKGVPAPANTPGARYVYASWKDAIDNLYVYGGYDFTGNPGGLSDLWKYNIGNGMWTWLGGPQTYNDSASFGPKCIEDSANWPGTGLETRSRWVDDCGNLWLFGSAYVIPFQGTQIYNTLWRYNPSTNLWAWMYGDTLVYPNPVYGTKGVSSPLNSPAATMGTAAFSTGSAFWIYGGMETLPNNDRHGVMWRFIPERPTAQFTADTVCWGDTTHFFNLSLSNCNSVKSQSWNFGDPSSGPQNFSSAANPSHIFSSSGTFSVQLIVQSCTFSWDTIVIPVVVTSSPLINASADTIITSGGSAQLNASGGSQYTWTPAAGLSCTNCPNPVASPAGTTTYCVTGKDSTGCWGNDCVTIRVESGCNELELSTILPNAFSPNSDGNNDQLCLPPSICIQSFILRVYDRLGEKIFETTKSTDCWDGTYKSKYLNTGVFVYYLDAVLISGDSYRQRGNISLIR
jgi:gliding motility-associated-like protein